MCFEARWFNVRECVGICVILENKIETRSQNCSLFLCNSRAYFKVIGTFGWLVHSVALTSFFVTFNWHNSGSLPQTNSSERHACKVAFLLSFITHQSSNTLPTLFLFLWHSMLSHKTSGLLEIEQKQSRTLPIFYLLHWNGMSSFIDAFMTLPIAN